LFLLRFETGDVYAPYSSLRSDPLGTRALHESLVHLNGSPVSRNYRPVSQLHFDEHTTLLYLGTQVFYPTAVSQDFAEAVDRLTDEGGRMVIAFLPVDKAHSACLACDDEQDNQNQIDDETDKKQDTAPDQTESSEPVGNGEVKKGPELEKKPAEKTDSASPFIKTVSLEEKWGMSFGHDNAKEKPGLAVVNSDFESKALPDSISWHSTLYFSNLQDPWKIIYRQNGHPVIAERPYKRGTILLCADSYLFSNEALRSERHPELLARLIGPNSYIVFDEAHLGIYEIPGIAGLIRSFGFHWFFLAIILLFILFIWKNAVHFVPPADNASPDQNDDPNSGRDYAQGLINLLRRNISVKTLLRVSLEEWKKSFGTQPAFKTQEKKTTINQVEDTLSKNQSDPIKGYNAIRKILSEGKYK
jgi:hypothetical protein